MCKADRLLFLVLLAVPTAAWAQGGNPLGGEFRVNTHTTGFQSRPSVAGDSMNNFIVVWDSFPQDGPSIGIFGQRYLRSGLPIGPEFRVNTYTTGDQRQTAVAASATGSFVVVWQSDGQDGSSDGIFGQRYDGAGVPVGPEFRVNSYTTGRQNGTSVASDAAGNFVVVWGSQSQDGSGTDYGVFGQRFASSGIPQGPEFRINSYTTGNQWDPAVASSTAGTFVVVWTGAAQDGSFYGVFGQRYAASGSPVGPEFRVNSYTTGPQSGPAAALDPSGNLVVVWSGVDQLGSCCDVFGQRYIASGTPVGPEFRVNTYATGVQIEPQVAKDSAGNFVVIWTDAASHDGSTEGVFGQRYSVSGGPVGAEFRVNTYTTGYQTGPSVATRGTGDFVVTWSSGGQDGSLDGVFGQRYGQIVPVDLTHFGLE